MNVSSTDLRLSPRLIPLYNLVRVGGESSPAGGFPAVGNWQTRRGFVCIAVISNH